MAFNGPNPEKGCVLLVQPPIRDFYLTAKRTLPYGLASIASALRQKGFKTTLLDGLATGKARVRPMPAEMAFLETYYGRPDVSPFCLFHGFRHYGYSYGHLAELTRRMSPFLVGISSLFTPYHEDALNTAEAIRRACPSAFIVMGGHHPTHLPEAVLSSPFVDAVLRGEGEVSMPELARAISAGKGIEGVPGIAFRKKNGALVINDPAWIPDLDALPLPALDLVNRSYYSRKKRGSTVIVAGRGCPMGCSYCSVGASSGHARFRQRSVESVLSEIACQIQTDDVGFIDFEDEHLTLDRTWFLELLKGIRERFGSLGIELRAMNGLFPPSLDAALVAAMKSTGFRTLNLSLGSTLPEQLRRFNRPDVKKALDRILDLARDHDLDAVSYLIAAAPWQDPLGSVDDLLFLAGRRTLSGLSIYYPAPGSRMYSECRGQGLLPDHMSLLRSSALPVSHTTTRLQAATLLRLSRLLNFMKALRDAGETVPGPGGGDVGSPPEAGDRTGLGRYLVRRFFEDGIIRGVTPDGEVFPHETDLVLSRRFMAGILAGGVRGVRGKAASAFQIMPGDHSFPTGGQ